VHFPAVRCYRTKLGQNLASIKAGEALLVRTNLMNENMIEAGLHKLADSIEMFLRVRPANYAFLLARAFSMKLPAPRLTGRFVTFELETLPLRQLGQRKRPKNYCEDSTP
jgi:hypothetical protein